MALLYKYQKGDKLEKPADYADFEKFHATLPNNLRDPNFKTADYNNPDVYNLYGLWDSLGKSKNFEQALKDNPYWQRDEEDGMYHGFSVNENTGEFLKPMNHPTTFREVLNASLNTDPYFKENRIIKNESGRLQYVPKNEKGGLLLKYQKGKTLEILDPEEFAYREKFYDDSLAMYNKGINDKIKFEKNILKKYNLPNTVLVVRTPAGKNKVKIVNFEKGLKKVTRVDSRTSLNPTEQYGYDRQPDGSLVKYNTHNMAPIKDVAVDWIPENKMDQVIDALHKTNNGYALYKKPTQPVVFVSKPKPAKKPTNTITTAPIVNVKPVIKETPVNTVPTGYAPYSHNGNILDPKIYGYGESTSGKPIQISQFIDSYGLKQKMREYAKDNSYPWLTK
jgi:hypothetical protein